MKYILIFGLLFFASMAEATMVVPLNLSQMTDQSEKIFRGRCLDITTELDENQMPATYVRFQVLEGLKGVSEGETVLIKQYGSMQDPRAVLHSNDRIRDGEKIIVPMKSLSLSANSYELGKEYLLFYYPESSLGFTSPVGGGQGLFDISVDSHGQKRVVNPLNNQFLKEVKRLKGVEGATNLGEIETTIQSLVLQPHSL
ncbi:MAG: hypothetical protein IPJ69_01560 [Deltaproteobacteria bacterium]|nr:MAG: hypothetical protein IPJ69_01560 [Deltaproteobacteria bacterium]